MADPDATTAAAAAILACPYPKVGEGTARNFAAAALRDARPVIEAEARAAERQRIRQHPEVGTIGDGNGHVIRYLVPADLLDGETHD